MEDSELSGLADGTLVYDTERKEYGRVVFDDSNSEAITIEWFSGLTRTIPFVWCRNIEHAFREVRMIVKLEDEEEEED